MSNDILVSSLVAFILLFVDRRTSLLLFLSGIIFIPSASNVLLLGGHFFATRILILGVTLRIFLRGEYRDFRYNNIDRLFFLFVVVNSLIYTLRGGDMDALINRLGFAFNALGSYFFIRFNLRNYEDTRIILGGLSLVLVILTAGMMIEFTTQHNPFDLFGASQNSGSLREGMTRCRASFGHPILAGTFGAVSMPLVANQLVRSEGRTMGVLGIVASIAIVIFSHSSGPVLTLIAIPLGFSLWHYRENMRTIRWLLVLFLLALHLVMKAPVWYLIGRISELYAGGTGWHRSALINAFLVHIREWWLFGTGDTAHWLPYTISTDPNNVDVTNQYIRFALDGGLLSLVLFIWLLVRCYSQIGQGRRDIENGTKEGSFFYWTLGVTLMANNVAFLSVSYFDQSFVYFCFLLALIAKSTFDKCFFNTDPNNSRILISNPV